MALIPQGPYRCLCWRDGKLQPTGITSYLNAKHLVDTRQAEAIVLDRHGFPQIYTRKGVANDTRTKL